jgi:hypothetical protein
MFLYMGSLPFFQSYSLELEDVNADLFPVEQMTHGAADLQHQGGSCAILLDGFQDGHRRGSS